MLFNFNPKSATLLIFFFHGLVFTIILFVKAIRGEDKANFWLGLFSFLCILYIVPFMCGYANWYSVKVYREILFFIPFQQLLALPPVIYFYIKSVLYRSYSFSKKDFLHFVPAILYLIYSLVVFITDKVVLSEYYFYADGKDQDLDLWYQIVGFISMTYYLVRSLILYYEYKRKTFQVLSFADTVAYNWIQKFLIAFLLLLLIRVLFFIINPEWGNFGRKYWYYLCFSFLFYYITLSGLINSIKIVIPNSAKGLFNLSIEHKKLDHKTQKSYTQPAVNDKFIKSLQSQIEELIKTKQAFKNPTLTLIDLSEELNTNPKMISQAINKGFEMNFNDYINNHRVDEVIKELKSGTHHSQTLLSIALESGFNSKSTFNRAFKKHTQLTPIAYIKKHLEK